MVDINEMYLSMIRNAYNKRSIEELKTIKEAINLMPMKYFIEGKTSLSQMKKLEELINVNLVMLSEVR